MTAHSLYQKNPERYHFESSDGFYELPKIRRAEKSALMAHDWKSDEKRQLQAIVKLEIARSKLANNQIGLDRYQKLVRSLSDDYSLVSNAHVFDDTKIHNSFYRALNER